MKLKILLITIYLAFILSASIPIYEANLNERVSRYEISISAGSDGSFAIQPDGSLWAWGSGVLGDGITTNTFTPIRIMDDVVSVSAGENHTTAIKKDGSLWAWGNNTFGQLGDGTTVSRHSPIKIMEDVVAVSAGMGYTMAIRTDGSLWAWGSNMCLQGNIGLLGDGTTTDRHIPIKIMEDVIAVSAGSQHTMAIRADGSLWAWGANWNGQLGNDTTTGQHLPIRVMDGVVDVSTGFCHTVAIRNDGSLWAWGNNHAGQLGDGTTTNRHSPVMIMYDATSVSAGIFYTVAIRYDGSLWAWGYNSSGQLGDDTLNNRHYPVKIMEDVIAVSAGGIILSTHVRGHTLAIRYDGSLWAWGHNEGSQLGDGTWINRSSPVKIMDNAMLSSNKGKFQNLIHVTCNFSMESL